eukprot:scaffold59948_cov60-Phaeocystis_antarctica.AAC.10
MPCAATTACSRLGGGAAPALNLCTNERLRLPIWLSAPGVRQLDPVHPSSSSSPPHPSSSSSSSATATAAAGAEELGSRERGMKRERSIRGYVAQLRRGCGVRAVVVRACSGASSSTNSAGAASPSLPHTPASAGPSPPHVASAAESAAVEAHVGEHAHCAVGRAVSACGVVAEAQDVRRHLARHGALQSAVDIEYRLATTADRGQRVPAVRQRVQVERGQIRPLAVVHAEREARLAVGHLLLQHQHVSHCAPLSGETHRERAHAPFLSCSGRRLRQRQSQRPTTAATSATAAGANAEAYAAYAATRSAATAASSECVSRAEANRGAWAPLLLQQPHAATLTRPRRNLAKRTTHRFAVAAQLGHECARLAVVQLGRAPRKLRCAAG